MRKLACIATCLAACGGGPTAHDAGPTWICPPFDDCLCDTTYACDPGCACDPECGECRPAPKPRDAGAAPIDAAPTSDAIAGPEDVGFRMDAAAEDAATTQDSGPPVCAVRSRCAVGAMGQATLELCSVSDAGTESWRLNRSCVIDDMSPRRDVVGGCSIWAGPNGTFPLCIQCGDVGGDWFGAAQQQCPGGGWAQQHYVCEAWWNGDQQFYSVSMMRHTCDP